MTRVLQAQKNREILDSLGWTGFALEAGAFITDPISWLGYGAEFKLVKPIQMATRLTRFQKFYKSGLVYGGAEATLFAPIVAENPTYGTSDLIIASALGGTLGGGITALFAKNLNKVAKAEMLMDINESGKKLTKKGEKEFRDVKKPLKTKELEETQDIVEDLSIVQNVRIAFDKARNLPFLGWAFNRSGALGKSKSEITRLFNFLSMEDPVGYIFTRGKRKGQVAPQDDTVELIRNQILQAGNTLVYNDVRPALMGWLKEQGHGVVGGFLNMAAKQRFMLEVARAIRDTTPSTNKWVKQAVQGYRRGFNFMGKEIVRSRLDGFERFLNAQGVNALKLGEPIDVAKHLIKFDQYLPRKISAQSLASLQAEIGEAGIISLIKGAIVSKQGAAIASTLSPAKTGGKTIIVQTQRPLKENLKKVSKSIKETKATIKELKGKKPKSTAVKSLAKWNARLDKLNKKL